MLPCLSKIWCYSHFQTDIVGFVGCVTPIKTNQLKTSQYFSVDIKTSPVNFRRIMISNHKSLRSVRQDFLNYFHHREGVVLKKLTEGTELLFFNNCSELAAQTDVMNFRLEEADHIDVADIDDSGLVLSVVGKFKFVGEISYKTYERNGRPRTERKLDSLFSDGTSTKKFTLWGDMVDIVKEDKLIQVACCTSKFWDNEIELYSTIGTMLCYLPEDRKIQFDDSRIPEKEQEELAPEFVKSKRIFGINLDSFLPCRKCKRRLDINVHTGFCYCATCKKEFPTEFVKATQKMTCVANIDILLEDGEELAATMFQEVIQSVFDSKMADSDLDITVILLI